MSKRKKIIVVSVFLSLCFLLIQIQAIQYHYLAIFVLSLLAYLLSGWALKEGLGGLEWFVVLLTPFLYTGGVAMFYFLLPSQWLTRISAFLFYGLGMYILLLTENIFSVATIRNIQLIRAAQATGFLWTLITAFFIFDTIFSFRLDPWFNAAIVFAVSFFLYFQGIWKATLDEKINKRLVSLSLVLALATAEVALAISFWPLTIATGSLFLVTFLYLVLGLVQNELQERLFPKTIKEYLWLGAAVFITIFLTTKWSG